MKRSIVLAAAIAIAGCASESNALHVTRARSPAPAADFMAVYFTVINNTDVPDTLVSGSIPGFSPLEVHETVSTNGVMTMRPVGTLEIPAGESVTLSPGGLHGMVSGFTTPPQPGSTLALRLQFAHAGQVDITIDIVTYADLES